MPNPFVGPRPLTKSNPIFGRNREITELRHRLISERLVLLHSPSGAGKSSLINAGLIPELEDHFDVWEPTRVNSEPPPEITSNRYVWSTIYNWRKEGDESTLAEFVHSHASRKNPLLIFDQFEEILRVNPTDTTNQNEFFRQLADLLRDPRIWALIVIREDYLAPLLPFFAQLPTHLRTRYRLDFLTREQAKQAMRETARTGDRTFDDTALDNLVNNLAAVKVQNTDGSYAAEPVIGGYVEPMHLQVVCLRLWDAMPESDRSIDPEDVVQFGDVTQALGAYYDSKVGNNRAIRKWFQEKLIKGGIRSQVQKGAAMSEELDNRTIERLLVDAHLVRAEERRGSTWFELAHDRLIEPVLASNARWFNLSRTWQRRAPFQGSPTAANPFVGPRPLSRADCIFGRDRAIADVGQLLISERLVLLHSPSGAGKSSLINAGLIPVLADRFDVWEPIRVNAEPPPGVTTNRYVWSAINGWGEHGDETTLEAFVAARPHQDNPLLIFDQFEEILNGHATDTHSRQEFFQQLAALLADPQISALFVIREDCLAMLLPYFELLPTHLRYRYRLEVLTKDQAKEAINETARFGGRLFEAQALDTLVNNLAAIKVQDPDGSYASEPVIGNFVEPMQLQVVCRRLWDAMPEDVCLIDVEDVARFGVVTEALRAYYDSAVKDDRAIREWFQEKLIKGGIRSQVLRGPGQSAGLPNSIIDELRATHLVRAAERGGSIWLELAHDLFIEPVLASNEDWFEYKLHPVQRRASLWLKQGRFEGLLVAGDDLDGAREWAHRHEGELTPSEKEFLASSEQKRQTVLREAKQNMRLRLLLCVALVAVVVAAWQWRAAEEEKATAKVALSRSAVQDASIAISRNEKNQALAQYARALRLDPTSVIARSGLADILSPGTWLRPLLNPFVHGDQVYRAAFSPDGRRVVTASRDKTAQVWDAATGKKSGKPLGDGGEVYSAGFSPDGRRVVTVSSDKTAQLWDAATGEKIGKPLGHGDEVRFASFSPDSRRVATASKDKTAQIWDAATGEKIGKPLAHESVVNSTSFNPDGRRVVTASEDKTAQVWDTATGEKIGKPLAHGRTVYFASFSPDGGRIVTASDDGTAQVWNAATGEKIGKAFGHGRAVYFASFSPDGRRVVTASADNTAQVWDAATGEKIGKSLGHGDYVYSASFSPDGGRIVTASKDKTAQVWANLIDSGTTQDTQLLADFAEAVAGLTINEYGFAVPLHDPAARLQDLRAQAKQLPDTPGTTAHFIRRFLPD